MSTKITPTVGRVVWFYPATNQATSGFTPPSEGQPLAAIIAAVKSPEVVNLTVFDAMGFAHARINVPLLQEDQDAREGGFYATWMPYQVEQAKKADERAHDAKQLAVASDRAADARRLNAGVLDMALRTPGLTSYDEVLAAARAYQAHIEGQQALTDPQILETFQYQLSIDGGDTERAAINTVRVLRGEAPTAGAGAGAAVFDAEPKTGGQVHDSDCAQHNEPAEPNGPCDCSLSRART